MCIRDSFAVEVDAGIADHRLEPSVKIVRARSPAELREVFAEHDGHEFVAVVLPTLVVDRYALAHGLFDITQSHHRVPIGQTPMHFIAVHNAPSHTPGPR